MMSVWRDQVAVLITSKREIVLLDMTTGAPARTLRPENKAEEPVDFKARAEELGTGLYVSRLRELKEGKAENYLCFHHFDIGDERMIASRRIRVPQGELSHSVSNSLMAFVYFANHSLVHAVIDS